MAWRSMMLHQNRWSCQKHITLSNFTKKKKQAKFSRASFQKETAKTSHQFFRVTGVSIPSDLQGLAAPLLSCHPASRSFPCLFFPVNKSHIPKKAE